ncbi:hypothetical protein CDEST_08324 [Colletotrichum destructivum]|uniref:DUF7587 domain-containing protein n=1 Tax=Colletotrichum destructivum TaxID=34406 RepID=A0AAX4IJW1_9PEZI|nr:hypothetical protein CDEST_08324 [Colletotrichum destructivum]
MSSVASKVFTVAQYEPRVQKIAEHDSEDIIGWVTKNNAVCMPRVLRVKHEFYEAIIADFPNYQSLINTSRNNGAVNGIALVSSSCKVRTVGGRFRPKMLYRAIHGDQPGKGIRSRLGRGSDPIFLQLHLQKHLCWRCREPSPFLSATDNWNKAMRMASGYAARNLPDVEIIVFQTSGPAWNHDVQRLWCVRSLIRHLGLVDIDRPYFDHEYLVEGSIPEESIVLRRKAPEADTAYMRQARHDLKVAQERAEQEKKARKEEKEAREEEEKVEQSAAMKRKADGLEEPEPEPKKRKTGKRVKVGIKIGLNVGKT